MKFGGTILVAAALLVAVGQAPAEPGRNTAFPDSSRFAVSPESIMPGSTSAAAATGAQPVAGAAGIVAAGLFAPAFSGDGQTSNWRIINAAAAGQQPWNAVGNFLIPGLGGYCSAVLVAPRVVLTANHCLYAPDFNRRGATGKPATQLMDATRFVFVAGVHDNTHVDSIPVAAVITGGWAPGAEEPSRDWAIAILARPARSAIVPIAFRPYEPKAAAAWRNKLVVAAYPGASFAFSTVLRLAFNCSLLAPDATNVLTHDCASESGSSGAPILVQEGGELRVIGIHSSRRAYSTARHGVAVNSFLGQLNEAIARLRQEPEASPATAEILASRLLLRNAGSPSVFRLSTSALPFSPPNPSPRGTRCRASPRDFPVRASSRSAMRHAAAAT